MSPTVREALARDAEVDAVGFFRRVALALARVAAGWRAPRRNDDTTPAAGDDAVTAAIRAGAERARQGKGASDGKG